MIKKYMAFIAIILCVSNCAWSAYVMNNVSSKSLCNSYKNNGFTTATYNSDAKTCTLS
jgi:hypothetical protein